MKLVGIRETGGSKTGNLFVPYNVICNFIFEPNVTDMDDSSKVHASWGIKDTDTGRKAFIWSYYVPKNQVKTCQHFSCDGDLSLLEDIFGKDKVIY